MWDEPVNGAIDEVARRMTEAKPEAASDLRRRVLARIESGDTPRRDWPAAFVLPPLAVAAAIVVALVVSRPFQGRDRAAQDPAPQPTAAAPADPSGAPGRERAAGAVDRRVDVARGFQPRARGPERPARHQTVPAPAHELPLEFPSLGVAALTVDALAPDSIQIPRLETIAPIDVAPLDVTDDQRRDE